MPGTVDSLNIQISAEASAANTALGNLTTKLNTLSSALNKVNTSGIKSFSTSMNSLTTAMQGMKSVNASQFTKVANGIAKLTAVDTSKLATVSNVMKPLASAISSLNGLTFDGSSINSLINALTRLSNANVSGLNSVNFTQLGNSLKSLINALSGASDVSSRTVQITNAIAKLGASGATIGQVSAELPALGTALKSFIASLSGAEAVNTEIVSLTTAIAALASAGSKIATTASNLGLLATALKELFVTLSSAPAVDSSIISMTNSLAGLAAQGTNVSVASKSVASGFNVYSASASTATKRTTSLAAAFSKLFSAVFILRMIFKGLSESISLSSDLTEVQNVVDVAFGEYKDAIEEFSETSIENYGINELTAKTIASRYQAMSNAIGLTTDAAATANDKLSDLTDGYVEAGGSVADMSVNLTKLAADMGSFYNVDADEVAEDLESIFTGTTKPLRQYGLDLTQATLQEWALKNGLDADISSMTQAEKVLLRYQYVLANTSDAQGDFSRTSDTWANRVRVLKLQFQSLATTLGSSLINAFKPALRALNNFMTKVISFVENVANALGKIFGWTIETTNVGSLTDDLADETTDATDDIADGYDDATAAAEEYENTVLSIDELHKLNSTNEDSGSGGGSSGDSGSSGTSGSGYSSAIKQTESLIDYYKSSINSLYELGEYIGTTLTNALNNIDWDRIYQSARNFGTGLAEFLNGLISPELFYAVGRTIANALNTAIYASLSFATTFDWENLGLSIAAGVNGFFQNFDFRSFAASINAWVQGIWTMIRIAIKNISWKDVWNGITDFLGELDVSTIAIIIGAVLIKKILKMKLLSGAFSIITKGLQTKLANFLSKNAINIASIALIIGGVVISASAIKEMKEAGISLGEVVKLGLGVAMSTVGVAMLIPSVKTSLTSAGASVATTFVAGVKASFGSKAASSALSFISPFTKAVTGGGAIAAGGLLSAFAIKGMWDKGYNAGDEVKLGIGAALAGVGAVILAPFTGGASIALFTGIVAGIFGGGNLAILIKNNIDEIAQFFKDLPGNILSFFKGLPEKVGEITDSILQWFSDLPGKIGYALGYAVGTIVSWVKDMVQKIKEKVPEIISNIVQFFKDAPKKIKEAIGNAVSSIGEWAKDMIQTVKEKVPEVVENIIKFFKEIDLKEIGKDIINGLWEGISNFLSNIKEKWKEFKESFVQGFKDALGIHSPSTVMAELAPDIIEGIFQGMLTALGNLGTWLNDNILQPIKDWFSGFSLKSLIFGDDSSGSDTTTVSVKLKKKGWKTLSKWLGTNKDETSKIKLKQKGWKTLSKWLGTDSDETSKIKLKQKGWKTLSKWLGTDSDQTSKVKLKAKGWSTLTKWLGTNTDKTQKIKLGRNGWTSLTKWLGSDTDKTQKIKLGKNGWSTLSKFIGIATSLSQKIGLSKNGWSTLSKFIGIATSLTQKIGLGKHNWSSLSGFIGIATSLTQKIGLSKKNWTSLSGFVGIVSSLTQKIGLGKYSWTSLSGFIGVASYFTQKIKLKKDGWSSLSSFIGSFTKTIKLTIEWTTSGLGTTKKAVAKALWGEAKWPKLKFAAGGFLGNLSSADLLVTRENGIPEMVGRIGSQTAVANNDQIAAGIAAAVQPAVYNAMMAANANNRGGSNAEIVIELDGNEIGRTAVNFQKLQNKRYTVEPSFV